MAQRSTWRPTWSTPKWSRVRMDTYARDGYVCVRCGWGPGEAPEGWDGRENLAGESYPAGSKPQMRQLEMDHIEPHFLGGRNVAENFQTLCSSCNASKGHRA